MISSSAVTLEDLAAIVAERGKTERSITAIAGAPGSGKSTLAERLAHRLNAQDPGSAAVFPMDGYHYDDSVLEARGQHPRKGAPFTFDVAGFGHMLDRLRANSEAEIAVPVFDRALEVSRNAARIIPDTVRHLIVEGNYLLLDHAPWSGLRARFDTAVFLRVPEDTLKARLLDRWKELQGEALRAQMDENDLPNALLVARCSTGWDYVLDNV